MTAVAQGAAARHMDRIYRRQRAIYDLTRKYYLLGRDALIRDLVPPPGGTVLEVGCGTGRNLILAARAYPGARLHGLDVSAAMLETAAASVAKAGQARAITLAQADASDFEARALFGVDAFDRIFLSYTLSMIPPWRAALDRAVAALASGGQLHIIDFGQQEGLPRGFRALLFAWLAKFDVGPRADLFEVLEGLAAREGLVLTTRRLHRGYAWSATLVRPGSAR